MKVELIKARAAAKQLAVVVEIDQCRKFRSESDQGVGFATGVRGFGTRFGQSTIVAIESRVVSSVQEAVPPVEWAAEVQRLREELTRARATLPSLLPNPTKVPPRLPICCRRGLQNFVQELRSQAHQSTRRGKVVIRETFGVSRRDGMGTSRFWVHQG